MGYVKQTGTKRKADTIFPIRAYLLSGETPDLIRLCARLIAKQCPEALEAPPKRKRDTPSLQAKSDIRAVWTSVLLTAGYASLRSLPGTFDLAALLGVAATTGVALVVEGALEVLWFSEELMIESRWYFEEPNKMLAASLGMC